MRALDLLPEADHLRRGPAASLLAVAHWASGDLVEAYQTLAEAMANFQKAGNLHFAISGTYGLADIRTVQGRLRDAVKTYAQVLQLVLAQGEPLPRGTADLYWGLSELYHEQSDADAAIQNLLRSEELGEKAGLPRYRSCRVQARFKQTKGDLAGALDMLDEAGRHYRRSAVPDVRPLAAWKTRVWIAQGRLPDALRWVQEKGLSVDDELSYLREFEHITLARVLIAEGMREPSGRAIHEAVGLLDRLQQAAEAGGRMGNVIEIGVLQALAHQAQGSLAPALVALERVLKLAEPEGYVRVFVDEGQPLAKLLYQALAQEVEAEYVRRLLAAFPVAGAEQTTSSPLRVTKSNLVEPLSEREIEVLQLIAEGLSNQEVAARLYLSPHTVKVHARKIYGKLGAGSRTQAIAKAKTLGILPHS
jgi:LuxR family maltose regulon positive regulatory protein